MLVQTAVENWELNKVFDTETGKFSKKNQPYYPDREMVRKEQLKRLEASKASIYAKPKRL